MDYVAEVARLEKLLLEAFDKQSKLESRIEELTVDHEQFHCLNDENDVLGIENEKLKQRVAELETENKHLSEQGFKAMVAQGESLHRIAELEANYATALESWEHETIQKVNALKHIAELETALTKAQEQTVLTGTASISGL